MNKQLDSVLLVDDDEPTNFLHELIIKKSNRVKNILTAPGVDEAFGILESNDPELIFLDINMPGLSGWDFIEKFKDLSEVKKSKSKVVMLTTSMDPLDREKAQTYHEIKDFMNKPISLSLLEEILEKHF